MPEQIVVSLNEGQTNTTPWGQVDKKGVSFLVSDAKHIEYYKSNGRYSIGEPARRKRRTTEERDTEGAVGRSGHGKGLTITPERLKALCEVRVDTSMKKDRLLALAADLGVGGIDEANPPTNAQLIKLIQERQATVLEGLDDEG